MNGPTTRELVAYLEGDVTPSESAAIERQVNDSAAVRSRLEHLQAITKMIGERDDGVDDLDLVAGVRSALMAPIPSRSRRGWLRLPLAGAGVLAAAAALIVIVGAPGRDDEVREKGGGALTADRWLALVVYQIGPTGEPRAVDSRIAARAPLAFTYTNLGPTPMTHLMVVAVDSRGKHEWYFPEAGTAIPARVGEGVELPEQIAYDLPPGPLVVYAIFARRPLGVAEAEAFLGRAPPPGVVVLARHLEVDP